MAERRERPSEAYDEAYYFSEDVEGYEEFFKQGKLSHLRAKHFAMLEVENGTTLLEIGFARGDLLRALAEAGARVTGVEFSPCACRIAKETLAGFPNADIRQADCRALPFEADSFERVFAGDVIEHLCFKDGVTMLEEMYRVLKPGGFMVVHTTPNTVFRNLAYPLVKPVLRVMNKDVVAGTDEQFGVMDRVHVHEHNLLTLKKAARLAGLPAAKVWIDEDLLRASQHRLTQGLSKNRLVRIAAACGKIGLVRFFLGNDIYLKCRK